MKYFDCIIIGGGAAGLMCAATIAKEKISVAVLEHNNKFGKKIIISGGGRCNFTNLNVLPEHYYSSNPHFCKSALASYTSNDFIDLVKSYKIPFHEKKMGQLFCDHRSSDILDLLLDQCRRYKVQLISSIQPTDITVKENFEVCTTKESFKCKYLVLATGGLSMPPLGATDFGYKIAKQFNLKLTETRPALVPLLYAGFESLAGVSLPVSISVGKHKIDDDLLFTHKGFSGPAILKASLFWHPGETIHINFLPTENTLDLINNQRKQKTALLLNHLLGQHLPQRFVKFWLDHVVNVQVNDLNNISNEILSRLNQNIHQWSFVPTGTEGYKKAEVTRGGICTSELSSKTMESKKIPNLYFIGELVDITGLLGGYNFQWSWSSAYAAGKAIINKN